MFSIELLHLPTSPSCALPSHTFKVFIMLRDMFDPSPMSNSLRISGNLGMENGSISAKLRGKNDFHGIGLWRSGNVISPPSLSSLAGKKICNRASVSQCLHANDVTPPINSCTLC
eukprot:Gb_06613 [translate_table: standard]